MPFTPFHFGPSAVIALPLNRYIDIPTFLLANIAVDIEPIGWKFYPRTGVLIANDCGHDNF